MLYVITVRLCLKESDGPDTQRNRGDKYNFRQIWYVVVNRKLTSTSVALKESALSVFWKIPSRVSFPKFQISK